MAANPSLPHAGTHEVTNQPAPLVDYNLFESDRSLVEAIDREGAGWAADRLRTFGETLGRAETLEWGQEANRNEPRLRTYDRFGHRIDEVAFHPAWHEFMTLGMAAQQHALPWNEAKPGAHVARAAMTYLMTQVEAGCCCPLTMTFAGIPALRQQPDLAALWEPRLRATKYDKRAIAAEHKTAALLGMAMTEKQGGSDVRTNSTKAEPAGSDGAFLLTGHKWFCSAPMCDAFLTLAQSKGGLTCFLVPRRLPDGSRNSFIIQRLKDKLGNRSNASSEVEYQRTWARQVGDEGRGVATIIEMVHHTRLDVAVSSAGLMRQALAQACHHAAYRTAFQRRLVDQPLMQNVLADLAVEAEAATLLVMRLARAFDEAPSDQSQRAFARLATALAKFWVCKRTPGFVFEAMECHGGNGYVEESPLPRLYREAPLSSIWEGCGNVIALDVLRSLHQEPACLEAYMAELAPVKGVEPLLDRAVSEIQDLLKDPATVELHGRHLAGRMALALQAALLVRHGDPQVAEVFCLSRLGDRNLAAYGCLPAGLPLRPIIDRQNPETA